MSLVPEFLAAKRRGHQVSLLTVLAFLALCCAGLLPALSRARQTAQLAVWTKDLAPDVQTLKQGGFTFTDQGQFYRKGDDCDCYYDAETGLFYTHDSKEKDISESKRQDVFEDARKALERAMKKDDAPEWLNIHEEQLDALLNPQDGNPAPAAPLGSPAP